MVGEFSSPKQGTFYHYNDFWRLDPSTREWNRIETKSKGPPARSGHRMTYYKVCILRKILTLDTKPKARTILFYSAVSRIHHNRPATFKIYGYTIVRNLRGITPLYLLRRKNQTLARLSPLSLTRGALFFSVDILA